MPKTKNGTNGTKTYDILYLAKRELRLPQKLFLI
nr:MAG TPA: hypothetical protein [Caudoviricetes sp.]